MTVFGYSSFLLKSAFKEYILFFSLLSFTNVESSVTVAVGISKGLFYTGDGLISGRETTCVVFMISIETCRFFGFYTTSVSGRFGPRRRGDMSGLSGSKMDVRSRFITFYF
jgi:hypothetical protein